MSLKNITDKDIRINNTEDRINGNIDKNDSQKRYMALNFSLP